MRTPCAPDNRIRPARGKRNPGPPVRDVPLLSADTLKTLVERHAATGAAATVVTAVVEDPTGYGRIVRSGEQIARIVEEKDASPTEREIREINAGIYAFTLDGLFDAVRSSPPTMRRASITFPIWWPSTGSGAWEWKP